MFKDVPKDIIKTDKQLSQVDPDAKRHVEDFLKGCVSSGSKDSQYTV